MSTWNPITRRRDFRIGIEPLDDIQRCVVDVVASGIPTVIQIHADDGIVVGKDEADAIGVLRVSVLERCLERRPCLRVRR